MSIFDNFKSVFNNKNKQISSEPIDVSSSEFYNPTFNIPKSIYEEPTPNSIAHNITAKQTFALSFLLDMAYVAATADNSFYLPKPYKISHAGKNRKIFEEKFNSDIVFTSEYYKKNIKVSKKLDNYVKPRKELFEIIQTVYPEFCHNMENKIFKILKVVLLANVKIKFCVRFFLCFKIFKDFCNSEGDPFHIPLPL